MYKALLLLSFPFSMLDDPSAETKTSTPLRGKCQIFGERTYELFAKSPGSTRGHCAFRLFSALFVNCRAK
jgi:hypothetical protein